MEALGEKTGLGGMNVRPSVAGPNSLWQHVPQPKEYEQSTEVASRLWVLGTLRGIKRSKNESDLKFLKNAIKIGSGVGEDTPEGFEFRENTAKARGVDGRSEFVLDLSMLPSAIDLSNHDLSDRDMRWQVSPADRCPVEWEVNCLVKTGFVGLGVLKGYSEIRELRAKAVIKMS